MSTENPCLSCGACCAHFRVSFYWGECQSAGGLVPDHLTVAISPYLVAMQGTEQKPVRCTALLGEVGCGTRCTVYRLGEPRSHSPSRGSPRRLWVAPPDAAVAAASVARPRSLEETKRPSPLPKKATAGL